MQKARIPEFEKCAATYRDGIRLKPNMVILTAQLKVSTIRSRY